MNKKHIEDIICHEFKKTPYHVSKIIWHSYDDDNMEAVICIDESCSWEKLYRRFARLESKLNKKYGIMLDCVTDTYEYEED